MKMNKKPILAAVAAGAAVAAFAATVPTVSSVTMAQSTSSRLVTITYNVDAEAVITLDIQTNYTENAETKWASIGGEAIWNAAGDVWKKVASGSHTITWRPDLSWPDHKIEGEASARAVVTAWALDNPPDYMVVNLALETPLQQTYYPGEDFLPKSSYSQTKAVTDNNDFKTTKLVMRKILSNGITWTMGSDVTEPGRTTTNNREQTHEVTLADNYYIGVFEVTQKQWAMIATNTLSAAQTSALAQDETGDTLPMVNMQYVHTRMTDGYVANASWSSISASDYPEAPASGSFIGLLNLKTGLSFDLPSEAQWEFACRAGNGSGYWGDGSAVTGAATDLDELGSCTGTGGALKPVGSFKANDWGLYDMHGNAEEWCLDWAIYDITANTSGAVQTTNGSGTAGPANQRIKRGGNYTLAASDCRSARRGWLGHKDKDQKTGLRLVCPVACPDGE